MGVGDLVQGHEQRGVPQGPGALQQQVGVGVLVGGDLNGHALVGGALGQRLQVQPGGLQDRGPHEDGTAHHRPQAVVGLGGHGHKDPGDGHTGAGGLGGGVASADDLVALGHAEAAPDLLQLPGPCGLGGAGLGAGPRPGLGVAHAVLGTRGGALALQALATVASRALGRALLAPGPASGTVRAVVSWHC